MTPEEDRLLYAFGRNEMKNVVVMFFMAVAYGESSTIRSESDRVHWNSSSRVKPAPENHPKAPSSSSSLNFPGTFLAEVPGSELRVPVHPIRLSLVLYSPFVGVFLCLTPLALLIMLCVHLERDAPESALTPALSRRARSRTILIQIGVILLLFASVTINTACVLAVILLQLSRGFTRNLDEPILQRFRAADHETLWMFVYQTWAQPIQVCISI